VTRSGVDFEISILVDERADMTKWLDDRGTNDQGTHSIYDVSMTILSGLYAIYPHDPMQ